MVERFEFLLDGVPVSVVAEPKSPALEALRDQLHVGGVKAGCSPQGLCGCCTVLVDDKPRLTCTLPVKSLAGKRVGTLAGVAPDTLDRLSATFAATHAAQCGYCTPAIVLSASTLLQQTTPVDDDALNRVLGPHTCRCTGYTSIKAAISAAAQGLPVDDAPIGVREVVLGDRPFVDDLHRPGELHAAVVFAGKTGKLEALDLAAAEAMPGVVAALATLPVGAEVPFAGAVVAVVAAESRAEARAAAAAISPGVTSVPPRERTHVARVTRREGDVDAALAAAAHRVELLLEFSTTDAVPLEPEAALAVPGPEGLVVYSAGHDAAALATSLTARLGVPTRVRLVPSGGSYGCKSVPTVEVLVAELALRTGRPVKLALEHEEGTRLRARRPGARVEAVMAAGPDGAVTALRLHVALDGGSTAHAMERCLAAATGALVYAIPNIELFATMIQGEGNPTGPVRGAGSIPVASTVEALFDALAAQCGSDRVALRRRHLVGEAATLFDTALTTHGGEHHALGYGIALVEPEGLPGVVLHVADGHTVEVSCNVPELGQGRDRALIEALSTETRLPSQVFEIAWADSDTCGPAAEGAVEEAARAAARALAKAGGRLRENTGRRFVGEGAAAPGLVVSVVRLGVEGGVLGVDVVTASGAQDDATARSVAEGGAAMGLGIALAEDVPGPADGPESRFRYLGTLKAKATPRIQAVAFGGEGTPRDGGEAAVVATAAATVSAVRQVELERTRLPMKESAAARSVGVRVRPSV